MKSPFHPTPAPPASAGDKVVPEGSANLLSKLIFSWLDPFLAVGYSRPLQKDDLWRLPDDSLAAATADDIERRFYARCPPEKRPRHLKGGPTSNDATSEVDDAASLDNKCRINVSTDSSAVATDSEASKATKRGLNRLLSFREKKDNKPRGPVYDESLSRAIYHVFLTKIWVSGVLKLLSDTLKTTTPLLNKVLLNWLSDSYIYSRVNAAERATLKLSSPLGIGYGIGLAVALFAMQEVASLMTNHYMIISMKIGLSLRTGVISSVFRKSLRLSGRARADHPAGKITTIISTDATRLDLFSVYAHNLWVAPIQLIIGIGLLIGNLGYSALVGLGVLIFGFPIQVIFVKIIFSQRKKGVEITDKRVRLTTEILQGIRLIKFYAWEEFYANEIGTLRSQEIQTIRASAVARSGLLASATFLPVLASILSFITYALSGHDLNVGIIFSSLQLFNVIRPPLVYLPFVLSALSNALVALGRISDFLTAEELPEPYKISQDSPTAVQVQGSFTWESVSSSDAEEPTSKSGDRTRKQDRSDKMAKRDSKSAPILPSSTIDILDEKSKQISDEELSNVNGNDDEKPFELTNLSMTVPRGAFIGIVGRVGCGKSSVLQALIGEMRRTKGEVVLGGTVAYTPQTPWIRNATVRENILFGQSDDEEKFREIIHACNLEHDLEMLPNGEQTEIGEKGINLSGGQKARISLARAAYSGSDIVLLDDPLSAVDAYVGRAILDNCLLSGPLAKKTRILATHALHVIDKTDYIYVMDNGAIIEQGTYKDLMENAPLFSRLMEEYGNSDDSEVTNEVLKGTSKAPDSSDDALAPENIDTILMSTEERNTGAVSLSMYKQYLQYAGGVVWAPGILLLLIVFQAAQVGSTLFLGFWTDNSIHGFKQNEYIAVYAALGVAQAVAQFALSYAFALASLVASLTLFKAALSAILRSPVSFFDTTPMGRILSRLSKDQDTLDNELAGTLNQFLVSFSSVIGTIGLVFYTFPYLGLIFVPLTVLYFLVSSYYRRSSVETKRLDSVMRSILYGSFSETLTGLATIRAYRNQDRAVRDAEHGIDCENRAYYMTIAIQRWLAVRLDLFGNILILGIGIFAVVFRHSVSPSKIGVVLSYTLMITQIFSDMVSQFAQNEQNMNAVERVLHYCELEPEAAATTADDPPIDWPAHGRIVFQDVHLSYRPGLPSVLKGISFEVKPGEKIGIVGRTGAGKSSLLQALFRIVELRDGNIIIDDLDISKLGLDALRQGLALVPQDGTLFLGTLRNNIDPMGLRTDAELISALQRAWLLPKTGTVDPATENKFSLDSVVGDEGSNFSAGEKQLLALCRALVKNSKIIVLDEATSNVDVETDAKIQRTIQVELTDSTLMCIAHRLNTIAYYDRIIVMDDGKIAEFDTVLNLYDAQDSIFRSLCDEANLQKADILRIRTEHSTLVHA